MNSDRVSFGEALKVWTRIGLLSFGGPAAQIALMHRVLVDERKYYWPGRFPYVSRTGNWSHVAHYTQIIWPAWRRVGCATASNRSNDYLVCRYLPAGNIVGTMLR